MTSGSDATRAPRREHDLLGERELPREVLWGIHTLRARENFPLAKRPVKPALVHAFGAVKLACARANHELGRWDGPTYGAIERACRELMAGELDDHVLVDALQGGAGTSTNMNVNEVLANRALELLGRAHGDYSALDPTEDLNLHQSTNDTFPTAMRVAALFELKELEREVLALQEGFQRLERELAQVVKIGRTEMQDAVPLTLGREMAAYAEAMSRDRWRIYKCEERLRVVNLGGTAIGTGLGAPRRYVFKVVELLREITGLGLARAEDLVEATQNADVFAEVSGILKACAVNLLKITGDLRLLSSGPHAGLAELALPPRQAGSSIMPGKVNPVIPEAVAQAAMAVLGNDVVIGQACAAGSLELNPFLPLVADALLESIGLLSRGARVLREGALEGLRANEARCRETLLSSTAAVTALVEELGYQTAQQVALEAQQSGRSVREVVLERELLSAERFEELLLAAATTGLGSHGHRGEPG